MPGLGREFHLSMWDRNEGERGQIYLRLTTPHQREPLKSNQNGFQRETYLGKKYLDVSFLRRHSKWIGENFYQLEQSIL